MTTQLLGFLQPWDPAPAPAPACRHPGTQARTAPNAKAWGRRPFWALLGAEQRGCRGVRGQWGFFSGAEMRHPPAHPWGKEKPKVRRWVRQNEVCRETSGRGKPVKTLGSRGRVSERFHLPKCRVGGRAVKRKPQNP